MTKTKVSKAEKRAAEIAKASAKGLARIEKLITKAKLREAESVDPMAIYAADCLALLVEERKTEADYEEVYQEYGATLLGATEEAKRHASWVSACAMVAQAAKAREEREEAKRNEKLNKQAARFVPELREPDLRKLRVTTGGETWHLTENQLRQGGPIAFNTRIELGELNQSPKGCNPMSDTQEHANWREENPKLATVAPCNPLHTGEKLKLEVFKSAARFNPLEVAIHRHAERIVNTFLRHKQGANVGHLFRPELVEEAVSAIWGSINETVAADPTSNIRDRISWTVTPPTVDEAEWVWVPGYDGPVYGEEFIGPRQPSEKPGYMLVARPLNRGFVHLVPHRESMVFPKGFIGPKPQSIRVGYIPEMVAPTAAAKRALDSVFRKTYDGFSPLAYEVMEDWIQAAGQEGRSLEDTVAEVAVREAIARARIIRRAKEVTARAWAERTDKRTRRNCLHWAARMAKYYLSLLDGYGHKGGKQVADGKTFKLKEAQNWKKDTASGKPVSSSALHRSFRKVAPILIGAQGPSLRRICVDATTESKPGKPNPNRSVGILDTVHHKVVAWQMSGGVKKAVTWEATAEASRELAKVGEAKQSEARGIPSFLRI